MNEQPSRGEFLNMAALFEGGLAVVAVALGWMVGVDPFATLRWNPAAVGWGILATIPLFALFLVMQHVSFAPVARIRRLLVEHLGPLLDVCRWHDLLALALIAGIAEELLFRGVLQAWLGGWGRWAGILGSNMAFGLAHFITPTYAILAAFMGLYFSWVYEATGEPNLIAPMLAHALYDWLAFLIVVRTYRKGRMGSGEWGVGKSEE